MLKKELDCPMSYIGTKEKLIRELENISKVTVFRNMSLKTKIGSFESFDNLIDTIIIANNKLFIVNVDLEIELENILRNKRSLELSAYKRTTKNEKSIYLTSDPEDLDYFIKLSRKIDIHRDIEFLSKQPVSITIGYYSTKDKAYDERCGRYKKRETKEFVPIYQLKTEGILKTSAGNVIVDARTISSYEVLKSARNNSVCSCISGSINPGISYRKEIKNGR